MKQLTLMSPKFDGEIDLIYGSNDQLVLMDLQKAYLTNNQVRLLKERIPTLLSEEFHDMFKSFTIIEKGYAVPFESFWTKYGKKINRLRCEKIWHKLSEAEQVNAFVGLTHYEYHLKCNKWKSKADPETYLKNRYWENEWK